MLVKSADPDKYVYSGHGIGSHSHSEFLLPDSSAGKISSSVHINIRKKIS